MKKLEILIKFLENSDLLDVLGQPNILILLAIVLFLMGLNLLSSSGKKSQRTSASLADRTVKYNLAKEGVRQLNKFNIKNICLYSGSFKNWQTNPILLWVGIFIFNFPPSLFIPSANPGIEVLGAPGMGKTFSVIDRLLLSAIEQFFPITLYDYKSGGDQGEGGQTPLIASFAAIHGYSVRIFAPGKDYTCTINPLDFIKDATDISGAETLAKTFQANLRDQNSKTDDFFGSAGERLLYASFLWAKNTIYPDLAMAFSFLKLPDLDKRLRYALEQKTLPLWNEVTLSQFMSFLDAAETRDGIMGGAQHIASIFIRPDMLPCMLGSSNVSLELGKKEILIFQSDEERQRVYNPLIAGIIELLINRNFSYQRKVPLVLSLDEYPTLKIDESIHWPNRHRSKGLIQIVGYQSKPQLNKYYGKHESEILRVGIKNRFLFNTQNLETEKEWSEVIGQKEVTVRNKSTSYNKGKMGKQISFSDQATLTPILRTDDLRSIPEGSCVYINSHSKKGKRSFIPMLIPKIRVSKKDQLFAKHCEDIWATKIVHKIIEREKGYRSQYSMDEDLRLRLDLAQELLPLPPKDDNKMNIDTMNFML